VRTVPGLSPEAVRDHLAAVAGDEVRVDIRLALEAIDTDPADEWVGDVFDVMAALTGGQPRPRGLAYFTDASALAPAYGRPPTIICGPGDAEQAHRTDESCSVAALGAAADGFFQIARRWCGL
jgi:succinyl-diaminopimelate desuccinylase